MMKRVCDTSHDTSHEAASKQLRVSTVRLNVGGRAFETTADTLQMNCPYFEAMLSGRIGMAVDSEGRYFIDRSSELFAILLEWMRTLARPDEKVLNNNRAAILRECEYYGVEGLQEVIRGSLSPSIYLRSVDRAIRAKEEAALQEPLAHDNILLDVHASDTELRPRDALQQPIILGTAPRPTVQGGYAAFYERLNAFSRELIDELRTVENIVVAGGSVLASLVTGECTDIDIFVVGSPDLGVSALRQIFDAVQRHNTKSKKRFLTTRSQHCVTFYLPATPPIQVILQTQT